MESLEDLKDYIWEGTGVQSAVDYIWGNLGGDDGIQEMIEQVGLKEVYRQAEQFVDEAVNA
tara:strand:+ start:442 stop:624 length:183 start_codon:yes stop_codon:yes gene_type:complete